MTDYNKINQWYAEQCGVTEKEYANGDKWWVFTEDVAYNGNYADEHPYKWDIRDPRCRQKCREKYKIGVNYDGHKWWAESDGFVSLVFGDSIDAAELACLVAIYEGRE